MLIVDRDRLAQRRNDFGGDAGRIIRTIHVGQDDDEFVTAKASDRVRFAYGGCQSPCYLNQQLVTNVVAERVVDDLEAIEVDE